ncbi:MAG: T9SS type A sorting domain-containing protein [Bacteroidales bacterium]|nr:T9SS type A sorting domain-containing protein [Bacteroidales bacterium]
MKQILNKKSNRHKRTLWAIVALMCLGNWNAFAATKWTTSTHTNIEWNVSEGCIYIDLMYWDDNGSDVTDFNAGFSPKAGYLHLSFGDTKILILSDGTPGHTDISGDGEGNGPSAVTENGTELWSMEKIWKDGDHRWMRIKWKVRQSQLNVQQSVKFEGVWWNRGATAQQSINATLTIEPSWSRSNFTVNTHTYGNNGATPTVNIGWSKGSSGNVNSSGAISLVGVNGSVVPNGTTSFAQNATSGTIVLNATGSNALNLNAAQTYKLRQSYTPTENSNITYVTESAEFTIPAYPQPANDFKAELNATTRKITLSWSIPNAPAANYVPDNFVIWIQRNGGTATTANVAYQGSKTNYSYEIDVAEGSNDTYTFRLYRSTTAQNYTAWNNVNTFMREISGFAVNTVHKKPLNAKAVLASNGKSATITWDITGNVWSTGTKFVISRVNVTTNAKDEITLSASDFEKKSYIDNQIRVCNKYYYEVKVTPNESYGNIPSVNTGDITPSEIGSVESVTASKGYFSDRAEINWTTTGVFDEFSILRKTYGTTEAYKQIATMNGSAVNNNYTYKDDTGLPGVIYEYRVKGLLSCAGETMEGNVGNPKTDIGFRTPTGDFYGRITFENGQAEEYVEVNATTEDAIPAKSLKFIAGAEAFITNTNLLKDNTAAVTLQAWVMPTSTSGMQQVITKNNMYELGIGSDRKFYFKVGTTTVTSTVTASASQYVHLTGVYDKAAGKIYLYINGVQEASVNFTGTVTGNSNFVVLGGGALFAGNIDEVRIWSKALTADEIKRDYNRYLTGGENGLLAYYTFNYATAGAFYDVSFSGANYNANHGIFGSGVTLDTTVPSAALLGYKGVTAQDGSYSIRSVPYLGNGTAYYLVPKLGAHTFESTKEVRFISANVQSHTVNFVDKSSFRVKGRVLYEGGTVPVNGVGFEIDNVPVMSRGTRVLSGSGLDKDNQPLAPGEFEFNVPIGVHEVKAVKQFHTFTNGGKITDPQGNDLNYQDEVLNVALRDNTTIRYIGRIAGGTEQEAFPVGHSLSTNNLGDGVTLSLEWDEANGRLYGSPQDIPQKTDKTEMIAHYQTTHDRNYGIAPDSTKVVYAGNGTKITVYPSKKTGEFAVNIIPEDGFTLKINVPGYGVTYENAVIAGGNFANKLIETTEQHEVVNDSIYWKTSDSYTYLPPYKDEAPYHAKLNYAVRTTSSIAVEQHTGASVKDPVTPFFGIEKYVASDLLGNTDTITLWNKTNGYILKNESTQTPYAIYESHKAALYTISLFEAYPYYIYNGVRWVEDTEKLNKVPVQESELKIQNAFAAVADTIIKTDEFGVAAYRFTIGSIEPGNPVQKADIVMKSNPAVAWSLNAIVVGDKSEGNDFVTNGPDDVLMVLRDPPGSKSYSYLEAGASVTKKSFYKGSLSETGSETWVLHTGHTQVTVSGTFTMGVETKVEVGNDLGLALQHSEQYTGEDSESTTYTTKIKYSTDDSPGGVGADADVYIGTSTNIVLSTTTNLSFIKKEKYDPVLQQKKLEVNDWYLVQSKGLAMSKLFNTSFAYSQQHVINVVMPMLKEQRNNVLSKYAYSVYKDYTNEQLQALANANNEMVVVSMLPPSDANYGKSNPAGTASYYRWFAPHNANTTPNGEVKYIASDTILTLNQSIERWEGVIRKNEQAKVFAIEHKDDFLLQNYSFEGASKIEYSEQYSTTNEHTSTFEFSVDLHYFQEFGGTANGTGASFKLSEGAVTTQGGGMSSTQARNHDKGFVLNDGDSGNYFSVDVMNQPKWNEKKQTYEKWERSDEEYNDGTLGEGQANDVKPKNSYSTFIFYTQGGATSCPYENEVVTKYFEPGKKILSAKTIQLQQPGIQIEPTNMVNVPSGGTGNFKLTMYNNAPKNVDMEAELVIDNASAQRGAKFFIDGAPVGNGRYFVIPGGTMVVKTLEVGRGIDMDYTDLKVIFRSKCDAIADTATFSIHFTPSCTRPNLRQPTTEWVYNTKLDTLPVNGVSAHYLNVTINDFDQNYDNFHHIELQRKTASQSDLDWKPLMNFYADPALYAADAASLGSEYVSMIDEADRGSIYYKLFMDAQSDQHYDIRAVGVCMVNGQPLTVDKVIAESEIHSGIKDMYCPRLFGSAQPADGILEVEDEIRLNFNEPIAQGLLTKDNFQVLGVRNGSVSDHSTSLRFDGINDFMNTEFAKNLADKNLTVELWIQPDKLQNATLFSHGNINESMELALTADECLTVKVGNTTVKSPKLGQTPANPNYADGSWAHVAMVYNANTNKVSAYYNFSEVISEAPVTASYTGIGNVVLGKSIAENGGNYSGKMHNVRVWEKVVNERNIQLNSLLQLAGIEEGLMAYYPMNEGRGTLCEDKARGASLTLQGVEWALPAGYAAATDGSSQYVKIDASTAAFTKEMDFTVEFWFKAEPGQSNATILSAGSGETGSVKPENGFAVGFDAQGKLTFTNNAVKTIVEGEYRDNNWHHFTFSVDRTKGRAQIYMDGYLTNYIDAANVGGIASDYIYLGARGWYRANNATTLVVDNYFKGAVDDIRFWELYRNEKMVRDNNNVKLTGKELGLVHYYPFDTYIEFQGTKFLEFTNKDMRISHTANPETDLFSVVGATPEAIRTSDIAPLKDAGPVADLDFDFVVNNDALIITLKEQEYKIAKTIVTFTVYDVRDLNGNSIVSPITWSAYIDRNQLRWETDRVDITKPVYEPYEFTVKAKNTGGAIRNYTINNIPAWLDVTPSSGTLKSVSYDNIKFSINEGLNVGTYNEVIYLTDEDNVSEPLTLNITIEGEKPDWKVNPKEFTYTMSVFGKMRFNNIFSANKGDILAAFDSNGKCIGVTTSTYDKKFDMWYALLSIYSNSKTASGIEFRMWEASTGKTYKAMPNQAITFVNNTIVGSAEEPVIFDGKEIVYRNIPLNVGWNWISLNLKSDNASSFDTFLQNADWTDKDQIKNADNFISYSGKDKKWVGTLPSLLPTSMYIAHSSYDQSVSISGSAIDPKSAEGTISLTKGWNYIGYVPSVNMTVKEALAGYDAQKGDIVKSQTSFAMFSRNEWVGNLGYMEANKGYMLLRTADNATTFNYPAASATLSNNLRSAKAVSSALQPYRTAFANNMVIVATTTEGVEYGDRINAYINGELRGTGEYVASEGVELSFITISGNETGADITFDLERNGKLIGKANNLVAYRSNAAAGSIEQPFVLDFGTPENGISVYPNPFIDKIFVHITSAESEQVQITLSDLIGRQVLKETRSVEGGTNRLEINGAALGTGIYILQVITNETIATYKVEKE